MREIVGREPELERLAAFVASPGSALVLVGEPGIGKTTLWEAGIAAASCRVLVARPSSFEVQLSFTALIDLCDGLELDTLAAPQRAALEVALLRRSPAGAPPEPHAIGLGLRNALAACAPVLVAIDDLQWLDPASAEALAFAARRLEDADVGFLFARRAGERPALERALERRALERVEVGPFGVRETRRLLADQLGFHAELPLLRRIVDATLGNPLFAVEVGRLLAARGLPEAGEDLPVPVAVEELLGTRIASLPPAMRRLVLAVALSPNLHLDELEAIGDGVEDLLDAALAVVDGERVRSAHPLQCAAAKAGARPSEQREMHVALAQVVREPEQRALHLALAAARPDAELAARIAVAADTAAARGARPEAVALAEQALRLTPPDDDARTERLLRLAAALEVAGERERLSDVLLGEVNALPPGGPRVRAWLMLADSGIVARDENVARVERALAEAGADPEWRARVLAFKALNTAAEGVERIAEAEAWAMEALPALDAVRALGWARALRGLDLDEVCERFRSTADPAAQLVDAPEPLAALRLAWRGEIEPARTETARFLALAAERGEGVSYAWLRLNLCELELRAGEWAAAERWLDEWAESDDGQLLIAPTYQRCRGLLAVGRGDADTAEQWAAPALAEARARDYRWQVLEASRALGSAALLAGDPLKAAEYLREVWAYCEREGVDEPGAFPVAPDLVEALAELGALEEARAVTSRLAALATPPGGGSGDGEPGAARGSEGASGEARGADARAVHAAPARGGEGASGEAGAAQGADARVGRGGGALTFAGPDMGAVAGAARSHRGHPWAGVTARRCAAVIELAAGDGAGAAPGVLASVAEEYERLGLRFDAARSLLALGRAQRRQRQWRAARDALGEAAARFDALGSPGWAELAQAELARVGGRKPRADGELTHTEEQVAQLAAEGRSNKEIAHVLFVTVHTVEAHLSSTYAKLGVRSRAQLAHRLPSL